MSPGLINRDAGKLDLQYGDEPSQFATMCTGFSTPSLRPFYWDVLRKIPIGRIMLNEIMKS